MADERVGTVAVGFLDPGHVSFVFHESMMRLAMYDLANQGRIRHRLRLFTAAGGLVGNRNEIARQFLDNTEADWLFTIDSDMGFGEDAVDRLVASADPVERPVVGGLCFSLRKESQGEFLGQKYITVPTCYEYVDNETEVGFRSILDYPRDEVFRVGGTGAACMLLHRSALEAVREKFGPVWYEPVKHPGGTVFSEDLSLCVRLADADIPVYVDSGVRTTHDKGGVFLDQDEYDRCRALHRVDA